MCNSSTSPEGVVCVTKCRFNLDSEVTQFIIYHCLNGIRIAAVNKFKRGSFDFVLLNKQMIHIQLSLTEQRQRLISVPFCQRDTQCNNHKANAIYEVR